MPPIDDVGRWLRFADAAAGSWRPLDPARLDRAVRAHSVLWCRDQLSADANPWQPGRTARLEGSVAAPRVGETPPRADLLSHQYEVSGTPVHLIEGRNFTLIRVAAPKALQGTAEARAAEIQRQARLLLSQPWTFRLPDPIDEGVRFSSNPDVLPDETASWTERGDGGIQGGELWFLCSRRVPPMIGFANDKEWFPETFRAQLTT